MVRSSWGQGTRWPKSQMPGRMPRAASVRDRATSASLERWVYRVCKSQWGMRSSKGWDSRAIIKPAVGVGEAAAIAAPAKA